MRAIRLVFRLLRKTWVSLAVCGGGVAAAVLHDHPVWGCLFCVVGGVTLGADLMSFFVFREG